MTFSYHSTNFLIFYYPKTKITYNISLSKFQAMRIIKKYISKGEGYLILAPTEEEDYWHIYNLVSVGDVVRSGTFRKITRESKTGVKNIIKKKITLTLKIVAVNYYAGEFLQLSLKGRNIKENDYLKMGQYHTFNLELNEKFTIIKHNWDSMHFKIIKDLSNPSSGSEVAAMVMDEVTLKINRFILLI